MFQTFLGTKRTRLCFVQRLQRTKQRTSSQSHEASENQIVIGFSVRGICSGFVEQKVIKCFYGGGLLW